MSPEKPINQPLEDASRPEEIAAGQAEETATATGPNLGLVAKFMREHKPHPHLPSFARAIIREKNRRLR